MEEVRIKLELEELNKQKEELYLKINDIIDKMDNLKIRLTKICKHQNIKKKTRHEPGSYYDRDKVYEYYKCPDCNYITEEELVYTGGYG